MLLDLSRCLILIKLKVTALLGNQLNDNTIMILKIRDIKQLPNKEVSNKTLLANIHFEHESIINL